MHYPPASKVSDERVRAAFASLTHCLTGLPLCQSACRLEDVTALRAVLGYGPNDRDVGPRVAWSCNDQLSISDQVHAGITGMPWVSVALAWARRAAGAGQ